MKGLFAFLIGMTLLLAARANTVHFAVVTKGGATYPVLRANLSPDTGTWTLEIGEVFEWVGHVENQDGQWMLSKDPALSLIKVDKYYIIAPSGHFSLADASASPEYAVAHRKIVMDLREAKSRETAAQASQPAQPAQPTEPIIIRGSGPVRTGTVYRDSSGRVAQTLEPGKVYHRRALDDREEQELIRRSQAIESGMSPAAINAMEANNQTRQQLEDIQSDLDQLQFDQERLRQQQWLKDSFKGW